MKTIVDFLDAYTAGTDVLSTVGSCVLNLSPTPSSPIVVCGVGDVEYRVPWHFVWAHECKVALYYLKLFHCLVEFP